MAKLCLEEALKKKKLSKRQFAKRLRIDTGTAGRYFRDGYNPTFSTLEKFSKAIGVKIRDLIKE